MRIFLICGGLVFLVDRATKILAVYSLDSFSTKPLLPDFFHLTLVRNTGVAFGLFPNAGMILAVISLLSVILITIYLGQSLGSGQKGETPKRLAWAAVAGGALGNAYDRIFYGSVIDFLDFRIWPVFNIADSAIVCGAATIAYLTFFKKRKNS